MLKTPFRLCNFSSHLKNVQGIKILMYQIYTWVYDTNNIKNVIVAPTKVFMMCIEHDKIVIFTFAEDCDYQQLR